MNEQTTRQRIATVLQDRPEMQPTDISNYLYDFGIEMTPDDVVDEIGEIKESPSVELYAAPPACVDCGFDGFSNLLNIPSQCPECHSERIQEPVYTATGT